MFGLTSSGSYKETYEFLNRAYNGDIYKSLGKYGEMGVAALANATPKDTGLTASSWKYDIVKDQTGISVEWTNTNVNDGVTIAVILQYGHGTGGGGYVVGVDYINPALRPIFDHIANEVLRELIG